MRVLGPIVQSLVATVVSMWDDALDSRHVTRELVGDDNPRPDPILRVKHTMQEALCGVLVASTLDQDVEHRPVLIHRAPQPVPTFVHLERHFVQVPLVATPRAVSTEFTCQQRAELATPKADGLVTDLDPTLGKQLLDIPVAESETLVQPDRIGNDLRRKNGTL